MSDYTLYNADCLDILPTLEPQSVDAVICDPPYGTTACKWDSVIPFAPMWAGIKRVLRPRGACVLFGSQPFTSALVMSNVEWFKYEWVWRKNAATGSLNVKRKPMTAHESLLVFSQGAHVYHPQKTQKTITELKRTTYRNTEGTGAAVYGTSRSGIRNRFTHTDKYPTSVLSFPVVHGNGSEKLPHPTQKPLALLEYLVKTYTNEGDTVLDFTMGSGTTGHACANTGRRFVGIEKDLKYFNLASERIATAYAPLRHMQAAAV